MDSEAQIPLCRFPRDVCNKPVMSPFAKFHYVDFPETSSSGEVGVMEFGLKGTSRVCRRRHGEVGIMEFGYN